MPLINIFLHSSQVGEQGLYGKGLLEDLHNFQKARILHQVESLDILWTSKVHSGFQRKKEGSQLPSSVRVSLDTRNRQLLCNLFETIFMELYIQAFQK